MPAEASERLKRLNKKIMASWEERTIKEVEAALAGNSLVLRDSLPEFLNHIAKSLESNVDKSEVRVKWGRNESTYFGTKHGKDRASEPNYTITQLIFEYAILRQVICETMEEEAPLSPSDREIIVCAVEQAVNDAATEFSEIFADFQEKLTSTLAHDLRGPISSTKMAAQLINRNSKHTDSISKVADRIVAAMDRLDHMIHDLLDGSRLRAGESLNVKKGECDLGALLDQAVEEAELQYPSRISYKSAGSIMGTWDAAGLRRIVDNLVSNAIKFSPPKSCISIAAKTTRTDVEICVQNFGKPISPEELTTLFQSFRRAENSAGKTGWGLGLTVVKGMTEAHGGKVEVSSSEKAGTIFKVSLPFVATATETESSHAQ